MYSGCSGQTDTMENKYIKIELKKIEDRSYKILLSDEEAGCISLTEKAELYFEILQKFQGRHIAASAVYDFTKLAHEKFHEPLIYALVDKENEIARHVLEHNGYSIAVRNENKIVYEHRIPETRLDDTYKCPAGHKVLYLAGGCFWGVERIFKILKGVTETKTGYANGHILNPSYEDICRLESGYKEAVRVTYNPEIISTSKVLQAFFICINPEQENGQKEDIGEQYKTGIYYKDISLENEVLSFVTNEKLKHEYFFTEVKKLECFYQAEEYHQDYLLKNPSGYCHLTRVDLEAVEKLNSN